MLCSPKTRPQRQRRRLQSPPHGFTLVEVLVALLIMSVIAAMGWQGVSAMSRAREYSSAATERTLKLLALVGQWEQDLQAVYDSPRVPGVHFDGAALRIVRRADEGVQLVVWSLREGVWRRWSSPVMTRNGALEQAWMASLQQQGSESAQLKLLEGVPGWQVYFFRGQGWSNAQSSADLVDAAPNPAPPASGASAPAQPVLQRAQLPTGVRLQLQLPEGTLNRDVMLAPQATP